jgi:predicted TIM-barrel fold metal-dependent hydrolase
VTELKNGPVAPAALTVGQDESESAMWFVDSHFHLWDPARSGLRYRQLEQDFDNGEFADRLDRLKGTTYLITDFLRDISESNVRKAVHVEAAIGTPDPVAESEWLQSIADEFGYPQGFVASVDLCASGVEEQLERHCALTNMRGVRVQSAGPLLDERRFQEGYAVLEKFNLVCGISCQWSHMKAARRLAERFPGVPLVLDHAGLPWDESLEYYEGWRSGIDALAPAHNVWCKISGLALCNPRWTTDSLRRWVLHCIEAFGPDRIVFGSNWPVDSFTPYKQLHDAYGDLISGWSPEEQQGMFGQNAEELYRL